MAKITLNLGAVLSELLRGANSNFTELYDAISKIQESVADGGEKAVVYATADAMVAGLNSGKDGNENELSLSIGDEIYILDDETPDFWVSNVFTGIATGGKPASWEKGKFYSFGHYTIRVSKAREIDLADYQKIANLVTSIGENSDDTHYPSAKAVYEAVKGIDGHTHANKALLDSYDQTNADIKDAVEKKHSHSNKNVLDGTTASFTTEEKTKLSNIDDSLCGVTADEIGKVKDVKVNGTSVLDEATGVAAITVADLAAGFVAVATTDSVWTTKDINGTTYQAIKVAKTNAALGVFNSDRQEIVVQKVYDDNYLYLCVGAAKIACTIRKLSGGAVGGGDGGDINAKTINNIKISRDDEESLKGILRVDDSYSLYIPQKKRIWKNTECILAINTDWTEISLNESVNRGDWLEIVFSPDFTTRSSASGYIAGYNTNEIYRVRVPVIASDSDDSFEVVYKQKFDSTSEGASQPYYTLTYHTIVGRVSGPTNTVNKISFYGGNARTQRLGYVSSLAALDTEKEDILILEIYKIIDGTNLAIV